MSSDWLSNFEPQVVGTKRHVEYWIPAEKLPEFNSALGGLISVDEAYFGQGFQGVVPDSCMLKGINAVEQFVHLWMMLHKSRTDFMGEINSNRKAVYVNSMFWAQHLAGPVQRFKAIVRNPSTGSWLARSGIVAG